MTMEIADTAEKIADLIADKERLSKYSVVRGLPTGDFFEMNLPYCIIAEALKKEMEAVGAHIPKDVAWRWEHVGSTSIPGMPGTWNPDALVLVPSYPPPLSVLDALVKCGFYLRGSFPLDPEDYWFLKDLDQEPLKGKMMTVHLMKEGNVSGQILMACRDRCKTDLWAFNDYKDTKIEAAKKDYGGYKRAKGSNSKLLAQLREEFRAAPTMPK